jgi:hypothetical protein
VVEPDAGVPERVPETVRQRGDVPPPVAEQRVAALPAETLHLADRHALHPVVLERVLHVVDLERLDDAGDAS